jgi:hypothetical protein
MEKIAGGAEMETIRPAEERDLCRIAEIEVFNYRLQFYPIFRDDAFYFREMQTTSLMERNRDALCSIFVYDDGGVGNATHLTTIPIAPNSPLPAAPTFRADEIENGDSMHPRWHIPIFAIQGIVKPAKTPLQDIHPTPENYNSRFNVNVGFR